MQSFYCNRIGRKCWIEFGEQRYIIIRFVVIPRLASISEGCLQCVYFNVLFLTKFERSVKFGDDWIRTADLKCWRPPLWRYHWPILTSCFSTRVLWFEHSRNGSRSRLMRDTWVCVCVCVDSICYWQQPLFVLELKFLILLFSSYWTGQTNNDPHPTL